MGNRGGHAQTPPSPTHWLHIQGVPCARRPGLGWVWFQGSTILPSLPAASAKFPSAHAESGRQWNTQNPRQTNPVYEHMGRPVEGIENREYGRGYKEHIAGWWGERAKLHYSNGYGEGRWSCMARDPTVLWAASKLYWRGRTTRFPHILNMHVCKSRDGEKIH